MLVRGVIMDYPIRVEIGHRRTTVFIGKAPSSFFMTQVFPLGKVGLLRK